MLDEPYRWLEAVGNRREYIEEQLTTGSPVVGLTYDDGILLLTIGRGQRKVFEIYDRIALSAIGHPADIEKLRILAIDAAHLEGFNSSATDVTLHRLVNFVIGPVIKQSFDEIFRSPYIIKMLMVELSSKSNPNQFYAINYDGSLRIEQDYEILAGTEKAENEMLKRLSEIQTGNPPVLERALKSALEVWAIGRKISNAEDSSVPDDEHSEIAKMDELTLHNLIKEELKHGAIEAAILQKSRISSSKFRLLSKMEIDTILKGWL
jgi:proteasome alpha subunit